MGAETNSYLPSEKRQSQFTEYHPIILIMGGRLIAINIFYILRALLYYNTLQHRSHERDHVMQHKKT